MKQEFTKRMEKFQGKEYELLLKEKCVLDAKQFLGASLLYLNYAVITEKFLKDIANKYPAEIKKEQQSCDSVEVLGTHYKTDRILNKLTLEWISHISNSFDCMLQFVNSALNLGIKYEKVNKSEIANRLKSYHNVYVAISDLSNDENAKYISSVYNYSKHTMDLYGNILFTDSGISKMDIQIPTFKYKNTIYESKCLSELIEYYTTILEKYLCLLEYVTKEIRMRPAIPNRYHIEQMEMNSHILGGKQSDNGIILHVKLTDDNEHINKCWMEDTGIRKAEIMPVPNSIKGQYLGDISNIEVYKNGELIGNLFAKETRNSALKYIKYEYEPKI